jgi:hypothetical protein
MDGNKQSRFSMKMYESSYALMKTKTSIIMTFVLFSAASLMILSGAPNAQSTGNPQTEPEVSVPSIVSTSTDSEEVRTLANAIVPSARFGSHIDLNKPSLVLDRLDVRSLTLDDNQIGVNRSVAVLPNTGAQKFVNPDGSQIIVLIVKSSGASGIGVHFRNVALADGEEVYLYGTAPNSTVFGPFTGKGPWDDGEFWSDTVDGDTVIIEFYKTTNGSGRGFEIFEVSHILAELEWRLRSTEPDVLNCEVDASCNPVLENNAVARIRFNNNGPRVGTGTLLNDLPQDDCPYFLTANHLVPNVAVARTVKPYWFYQTISCRAGILQNWVASPQGSRLLATGADWSLLRLENDPPVGAVFAGWTSVAQLPSTRVFGLHHPDGYSPPQFASFLRRARGSIRIARPPPDGSCFANGPFYEVGFTEGLVEPGSSGSGLFTSNGHSLVGVLSCGFPLRCPTLQNPALADYSKFSEFYPQIRPFIEGLVAPEPPRATRATLVVSNGFQANWKNVCNATGYRLDVATADSFTNYVTGYHNVAVGNVTSRSVSGLNASTTYYYRVRAVNSHGTSPNSNVVTVTNPWDGTWVGTMSGIFDPMCAPPMNVNANLQLTVSGGVFACGNLSGYPCFSYLGCNYYGLTEEPSCASGGFPDDFYFGGNSEPCSDHHYGAYPPQFRISLTLVNATSATGTAVGSDLTHGTVALTKQH